MPTPEQRAVILSSERNAPRRQVILQKYYVYDPGVRANDELGGLRVRDENDGKGLFVLAAPQMIQYWIDQGLMGEKPVGEISDAGKKLLNQITRGRTENPDETPPHLPKYDRMIQSGSPGSALKEPVSVARRKQMQKAKKGNDREAKRKTPEQRGRVAPTPPRNEAPKPPIMGTPAE
jgi:hypothetical protein